jgi:hypothetical protein
MNSGVLPDPSGFFEIRFESIGGLGAHAAGQILARAAVLKMNFNVVLRRKVRRFVPMCAWGRPINRSEPVLPLILRMPLLFSTAP